MARLTIIVEVNADPTLVDADDAAEDLIDAANEYYSRNDIDPVRFVSAEWADQ